MRHWRIFFYLFRQHLWLSLLVLGCLFLIVLLGQFADMSRYQSEQEDWSSLRTLQLAVLRTPSLLQAVLPHALLVSAALCVARAGRRLEVAILMQNGLSPVAILLPVAISAAALGLIFALAVNPLASQAFNFSESAIEATVDVEDAPWRRDPREIVVKEGAGAWYVVIDHVEPDTRSVQGISIYLVNGNHELQRAIEAPAAHATRDGWALDASREFFHEEGANGPPPEDIRLRFPPRALRERFESEAVVSIYDLPDKIRLAEIVGAPPDGLMVKLGWLVALPALLFAVAFLAGAIVLRPLQRGGWKNDASLVLLAAFSIYTLSTVLDALGTRGVVGVYTTAGALPVLCVVVGAALIAAKRGGNRYLRRRGARAVPVAAHPAT